MPKNDLIKQIQAEFARPSAEESLKSLKLGNVGTSLSNQKALLEIAKYKREQEQEAELQRLFSNALRGGGNTTSNPSQSQMPSVPAEQPMLNPALVKAMQNQLQTSGINPSAPIAPSFTPNAPFAPTSREMPTSFTQPMETSAAPIAETAKAITSPSNVEVITEGTPRLASIDALWEQNPLSREFLKKKGFEKKTEVKFDNKSGMTRVLTTYPSGRRTLETIGGIKGANGIPLTNTMITKNQNIVASVDNALPVLNKIKKLDTFPRWSTPNWTGGSGNEQSVYEGLVNQVLDSLIGAFGMPKTNEGLESVMKQVQIGHSETKSAYLKRIEALINDLKERKKYSSKELNKPINAQAISDNEKSGEDNYSSNEWETI
jgi:hypothetical protein